MEKLLESVYIKMTCLNLTPAGEYWRLWGSEHPLGDNYKLSNTHRSTFFNKDEVAEICSKVSAKDIQQLLYVGTPEDVARRSAPWFKIAGLKKVPKTFMGNFASYVLPELSEPGEDGKPRWHALDERYFKELNRLLAE